jgi:hypothetical protein
MDRRLLLAGMSLLGGAAWSEAARAAPAGPPTYFVLFHTPGPGWKAGVGFREQPGVIDHVHYMAGFAASGWLVMGGPFLDDSGGMMVSRAKSMDEAVRIANDDRP